MYEVLELISAGSTSRIVIQRVLRSDIFEDACRWAERLAAHVDNGGIALNVRYHVVARDQPHVLFTA